MSNEHRMKYFIAAEFKKLAKAGSIRKISVNDIAAQCQISRGTFYYHFKDKRELINWIYKVEIIKPVRVLLLKSLNGEGIGRTAAANEMLFQLLYQDKEFYCQAIKISGQNSLEEIIISEARENMRLIKDCYLRESKLDPNYHEVDFTKFLNEFFSQSNATAVIHWMKLGMARPPKEMAHYTLLASEYGLKATMESMDLPAP